MYVPIHTHPNTMSHTHTQQANWMCPSCVQAVKAEEEKQKQRVNFKEGGAGTGGCNCAACVAKRYMYMYTTHVVVCVKA